LAGIKGALKERSGYRHCERLKRKKRLREEKRDISSRPKQGRVFLGGQLLAVPQGGTRRGAGRGEEKRRWIQF